MWLLLLLGVAAGVVVDYDGGPTQGEAWIRLTLHGDPQQLLILQRVTWCKALVPNDQGPPPLATDCTGRNTLRMQLYPGQEQAVLKEPPSPDATTSPPLLNTFYIDPSRVGGWDARHQWLIIVEMSQRNGATYREVVRFNPLETTISVTSSSTPQDATSSSSSFPGSSTSSSSSISVSEGIAPVPIEHSWRAALLVLGLGMAVVALLAGTAWFAQQRRAQPSLARQRQDAFARAYGGAYEFGTQAPDAIEMSDMRSEERRLHKEDMEILEIMQ